MVVEPTEKGGSSIMVENNNAGAASQANLMQHMNKKVRLKVADGKEFDGYLRHADGQHVYLSIPIRMREDDSGQNDRSYGYPGYGYPGYGYPGYGYGYPGSYFGSLILPLAALTAITALR